jgi:hypothetical protein
VQKWTLGPDLGGQGSGQSEPEIRNPKPEKLSAVEIPGWGFAPNKTGHLWCRSFDLRASSRIAGFRISDFELRISGLPSADFRSRRLEAALYARQDA